MARKPNFNYEKNRREQDKKKKREEKRLRKQGRNDSSDNSAEPGAPELTPDAAAPNDPASSEPVK